MWLLRLVLVCTLGHLCLAGPFGLLCGHHSSNRRGAVKECPRGQVCDPGINRCLTCQHVCEGKLRNGGQCRRHCPPEYHGLHQQPVEFVASNTASSTGLVTKRLLDTRATRHTPKDPGMNPDSMHSSTTTTSVLDDPIHSNDSLPYLYLLLIIVLVVCVIVMVVALPLIVCYFKSRIDNQPARHRLQTQESSDKLIPNLERTASVTEKDTEGQKRWNIT